MGSFGDRMRFVQGILRWPFLGRRGLRSGWRIVLWLLLVVIFTMGASGILHLAGVHVGESPSYFVTTVMDSGFGLLALGAAWLCARFLDRKGAAWLGFPARPAPRSLGLGTAIGGSLIVFALAVDCLGGWPSISAGGSHLGLLFLEAIGTLGAAAAEEIVFRGYFLQQMTRGMRFWPALTVSALLFAAVHLGNPGIDRIAVLNILVAGFWLGAARAISGDLWLPIGMHFGWNAAQGLVFGVPVSGISDMHPLAVTTLHGSPLFTGGTFGFEASVGGLVALGLGTIGMVLFSRGRPIDWTLGTNEPETAPAAPVASPNPVI